jgi:hypothetical protein
MYKVLFIIILGLLIVGNYMIFGKIKEQGKLGDRFSIPKYKDIKNEMQNTSDNSLTTQLNELVKMKEEGIISDDEFQTKRRAIIENYMD